MPRTVFHPHTQALIRLTAPMPRLPGPPDLTGPPAEYGPAWVGWLRDVLAVDEVADALEHASPALAQQAHALCTGQDPDPRDVRRAVLAVLRYLRRMAERATPFGLLAGVASARFGPKPQLHWNEHHVRAQAGAEWLDEIITRLERCPHLRERLPVVANNTVFTRGNQLIIPYQPNIDRTGAVEISLRHTPAVAAALSAATQPIRFAELRDALAAAIPGASPAACTGVLTELLGQGALITSLRAPSTETDALGHLVKQLDQAGAADLPADVPSARLAAELARIHALLEQHNHSTSAEARHLRLQATRRMRGLAETRTHPLALDLRLDGAVVLPQQVADELQRAALVLTRLSPHPRGRPAWCDYQQRFYERFGIGSLVPLQQVVADSGCGWPDGYPGTGTPERRTPPSRRDEILLALAQRAMAAGDTEIVLEEDLIDTLAPPPTRPLRPPPHLELAARVLAQDAETLRRGRFRLQLVSVSRGAGVLTGRFLPVLPAGTRAQMAAELGRLPGVDADAVTAQVSFPPLDPAHAHVARAPQTLPTLISFAEHLPTGHRPQGTVLGPADLAIGCDGQRMYLAAPALGVRLTPVGLHALNLRSHTPPLARLVLEVGRAQCASVTMFDWGVAAHLPFLPRLRYGRVILSAARWRIHAGDLPAAGAPAPEWDAALAGWRARWRLPRWVYLTDADRALALDVDDPTDRVLLRTHLDNRGHAVVVEAPQPGEAGWCGDRAHEVVVALSAATPPRWPRLPAPVPERVVTAEPRRAPGVSEVLLACLYASPARQDLIVCALPGLLEQLRQMWQRPPRWWFARYRDPDPHLRLRIRLPGLEEFGAAAAAVVAWGEHLHREGLLREVRLVTCTPETGRWGSGAAWAAAEEVFAADSRVVLTQLSAPKRPPARALVAANTVAIAAAFTGGTAAGMRWLIDHVTVQGAPPVPRSQTADAIAHALAAADCGDHPDPGGDRTDQPALSGAAAAGDWAARSRALAAYRACFPGPGTGGVDPDDVLASLLHVHFIRATAIDPAEEAACMRLARAAALAWRARTTGVARARGSRA